MQELVPIVEATLRCYDALTLQKAKKGSSIDPRITDVDVAVSITDLDDIQSVAGSFRCQCTVNAFYVFNHDNLRTEPAIKLKDDSRKRNPFALPPVVEALGIRNPTDLDDDERRELKVSFEKRHNVQEGASTEEKGLNQNKTNIFYKLLDSAKQQRSMEVVRGGQSYRHCTYQLTEDEMKLFGEFYFVPTVTIVNEQVHNAHTTITLHCEWPDSKGCFSPRSSTIWVMWRCRHDTILKENFELATFPFDHQKLSLDMRIEEDEKPFNMEIKDLRIQKLALDQTEFVVLLPEVHRRHAKSSQLSLTIKRNYSYYLTHIAILSCGLSALGLIAFSVDMQDVQTRMIINLTLLLTQVAFVGTVQNKLPNITYTTRMDVILLGYVFCTVLQTVAVIIPHLCLTYRNDPSEAFCDDLNTKLFKAFVGLNAGLFGAWWLLYGLVPSVSVDKKIEFDVADPPDMWVDFEFEYGHVRAKESAASKNGYWLGQPRRRVDGQGSVTVSAPVEEGGSVKGRTLQGSPNGKVYAEGGAGLMGVAGVAGMGVAGGGMTEQQRVQWEQFQKLDSAGTGAGTGLGTGVGLVMGGQQSGAVGLGALGAGGEGVGNPLAQLNELQRLQQSQGLGQGQGGNPAATQQRLQELQRLQQAQGMDPVTGAGTKGSVGCVGGASSQLQQLQQSGGLAALGLGGLAGASAGAAAGAAAGTGTGNGTVTVTGAGAGAGGTGAGSGVGMRKYAGFQHQGGGGVQGLVVTQAGGVQGQGSGLGVGLRAGLAGPLSSMQHPTGAGTTAAQGSSMPGSMP